MKPVGHQDQPNYPPPAYSPPGRSPPVQMDNKASAPPPPGLHAAGSPGSDDNTRQPPIIIYSNTVQSIQFGPYPMRYTCPYCNAHVMTETHSTPGLLTYILSGALCILAGYLLCCLLPCCVRECKDIEHRCPNCQQRLGLFKRI
jgi:lipopolysaccharide-induced tumor necrosis factor-alpha factor